MERRLSAHSKAALVAKHNDLLALRRKADAQFEYQKKRPWGRRHFPKQPNETSVDKLVFFREHVGDFEDRQHVIDVKQSLLKDRAGLEANKLYLRQPKSPDPQAFVNAAGTQDHAD